MKNKENINPQEKIVFRNKCRLYEIRTDQKFDIELNTNNYKYFVNVYAIKKLSCKLILGND